MNYTNLIITFIISFVVIVAIETGLSKWKTNVVLKLLQHQQYDELEKELHNFITRAFIPRYNIEYLRLNSYLMQNKHEMIEKQFDELMKFRKNKNQQADLLMKAFNYYVEQENAEKSHFYLDEIQKLGNNKMYQEALMMSDIFIDKKANHIDQLLEEVQKAPDQIKAVYYFMIAKQYENMNDKQNAQKYTELAEKYK